MTLRAQSASIIVQAVLIALSLQQIAARAGLGGGLPVTSSVPVVLGAIALIVMLRSLGDRAAQSGIVLPQMVGAFDSYVSLAIAAALYIAATHVADAAFGWWLAAALVLQGLWQFVLYAVMNSAGITDRAIFRMQDLIVLSALTGVATAIVWSLHITMLFKTEILAAVFVLSLVADFFMSRGAQAVPALESAPGKHG